MPGFRRKKATLILLVVFALVVLLYPSQMTVVPQWRVRVVDESGTPLANTGVRETWQHYDAESTGHEEDLVTDHEGYVTFPERKIRAPLAVRIVGRIVNKVVPHRGSGPDAFVIVLAPDYDTWSNNSALPGQPLPTHIVVKKNR